MDLFLIETPGFGPKTISHYIKECLSSLVAKSDSELEVLEYKIRIT
jgi:hypothetical protein